MKKSLFLFLFFSHTLLFSSMEKQSLAELKNGTFLDKAQASSIYLSIKSLHRESEYTIVDLTQKCENPLYKFEYEKSKKILKEFGLVNDAGNIENDVKNVVLSCVALGNFFTKVLSPFKNSLNK